jgi:hypothetical protein
MQSTMESTNAPRDSGPRSLDPLKNVTELKMECIGFLSSEGLIFRHEAATSKRGSMRRHGATHRKTVRLISFSDLRVISISEELISISFFVESLTFHRAGDGVQVSETKVIERLRMLSINFCEFFFAPAAILVS